MRTGLPNMSLKKLSLYISEWFLLSDNAESWVETPDVLFVWHCLFFSGIALRTAGGVWRYVFADALHSSAVSTLCFRCFGLFGWLELIILLAVLAALHYRQLLLTGRDLRFTNIAFFWVTWVGFFADLYKCLYELRPSFFAYSRPVYVPGWTLNQLSWTQHLHDAANWIIYSACIATSTGAPGISSSSLTVSAANLTEVVGSLLFVGLVLTTFVSKLLESKRNRSKP